jgi:glycerol-3-phosphate dehydrogenase (NAD(P)+)
MAVIAARGGHEVRLYARNASQTETLNSTRHNPRALSDFELPANVEGTCSVPAALDGADLVMLCLPAQVIPQWLAEHRDILSPTVLLCNTAKGLYLRDKKLLSEAIKDALGRDQPYAILSGE